MNREQIIQMAREAGFTVGLGSPNAHKLQAFAALVAEAERERWHKAGARAIRMAINIEREACAKVCDDNATDLSEGDWDSACINCADHIRARGEMK